VAPGAKATSGISGSDLPRVNRGDRREEIFKDDADRERFLETLGEVCVKTGWQVHAVCLMPNHFHLVVETPQGNLVAGMKWLLGSYTSRFNRRHKLFGHLFSGRYKALIVDGSGSGYLKTRRWRESDLAKRAKGDLGKVQIAGRLRVETLVTVKWIAARLGMGTAGYVNNRLYRWRKGTLA
jgi:REP element-mobilizing transposase RayT